jgi:hypothetical protein
MILLFPDPVIHASSARHGCDSLAAVAGIIFQRYVRHTPESAQCG